MSTTDDAGRKRFFISYAGPDRLWAEWIGWQLEQAEHDVELDVWDWGPGENFVLRMNQALRSANRVLALFSASYFEQDRFTTDEWTSTIAIKEYGPRLVPIRIENLPRDRFPAALRAMTTLDLFGLEEDQARRRLLELVEQPGHPASSPVFPGPTRSGVPRGLGPRLPGAGPQVWRVPARNASFAGRDALLVEIREALTVSISGVVVLYGGGGFGKTQTAIEYAHRFASDYDAVWVIDAEQSELITGQLAALATELDVRAPVTDQTVTAHRALAELHKSERWLLVFDNAEDPAEIIDYLPGGRGHVLITSRNSAWAEAGTRVAVEVFTREESVRLLHNLVPRLPPSEAAHLADILGDLPLALVQAAGVLASGVTVAQYERSLEAHATEILSRGRPTSYPASLAAATSLALERLAAARAGGETVIRACAYLASEPIPAAWFYASPGSAGEGLADALEALPAGVLKVSRAFEAITRYGLARIDRNELRLHRLTAAVIRDQTRTQRAAYRAVIAGLLVAAEPRTTDKPETWPDWAVLVPHVLSQDPATSPHDPLRLLATGVVRYLVSSGQTQTARPVAEHFYASWQEALGPDHATCLEISLQLAYVYQRLGSYAKSQRLNEDCLARCRRILGPDDPRTLKAATDLATDLYALGAAERACALNEETFRRSTEVLGENARSTLGVAYNFAIDLYTLGDLGTARTMVEEIHGRRREVLGVEHPDTLNSAGIMAGHLSESGQVEAARTLAEDTLGMCRRALGEDHPQTLLVARSLALYLRRLRETEEARRLEDETLERYRVVLGEEHPDTAAMAERVAVHRNEGGTGNGEAIDRKQADRETWNHELMQLYRAFRLL
ncbi:FxSxx-COOH system tetratricopeptide repeat protein [Actinomadura sp. 1N219]|uniref:FxSxx-COOH system tetratricopeptide repeat protein n=1 Tax=Actinomadura sp. 1N219 TaxID=3375152 RepID=UPI0037A63C60